MPLWFHRRHNRAGLSIAFMIATGALLLLPACASTTGSHGRVATPLAGAAPSSTASIPAPAPCPPFGGDRRKVQVVQINIPAEDVARYPELAEKHVGFGMSKLLVESLFDTGRFEFLEEKGEILKRLVEQWELTEDGILARDPFAEAVGLKAPEFLVYAEIFDFVACSPIEDIRLSGAKLSCVTSVGVQVRITKTATGEYIPGSTSPFTPEGKVVHSIERSLFSVEGKPFDQSAIGQATQLGLNHATCKALTRFDKASW